MAHAFDPAVSAAAAHRDLDTSVIRQARIAEAWDDLYYLERAAEVQLKAMASGRALKPWRRPADAAGQRRQRPAASGAREAPAATAGTGLSGLMRVAPSGHLVGRGRCGWGSSVESFHQALAQMALDGAADVELDMIVQGQEAPAQDLEGEPGNLCRQRTDVVGERQGDG